MGKATHSPVAANTNSSPLPSCMAIRGLLVVIAAICNAPHSATSDIIVDPCSLGYTNVNPDDPSLWIYITPTQYAGTTAIVGNHSTGEVRVDGGSEVLSHDAILERSSTGAGYFTINGENSLWLNAYLVVGYSGEGSLDITDGGQVSNHDGIVGYNNGSAGSVTVDGTGSNWSNGGDITIGDHGDGTMSVTDGGHVNNHRGTISGHFGNSRYGPTGPFGTGTVMVDGAGSSWTNSSTLLIGDSGEGRLDITNGGQVSNRYGYIGYREDSTGMVTVDGPGSTWATTWTIYIGEFGNGSLNIINGGHVSGGGISLGNHYESNLSYPTTRVYSSLYDLPGNGSIHFQNGTLDARSVLASSSDLTGSGTINTGGWVFDKTLLIDGGFNPNQQEILNAPGQNITVNVDMTESDI